MTRHKKSKESWDKMTQSIVQLRKDRAKARKKECKKINKQANKK